MNNIYSKNIQSVYDVFCEVAAPQHDNRPFLLWKYPDDYADAVVLKALVEFAFPLANG
jgi:hypothetical protein